MTSCGLLQQPGAWLPSLALITREVPYCVNLYSPKNAVTTINKQKQQTGVQGGPKKWGHTLTNVILSKLNRFKKKIFFTARFLGKFVVKRILKIPPHLACVATLLCETLVSAEQAINHKLLVSIPTYLRCGGVVNNQTKKG